MQDHHPEVHNNARGDTSRSKSNSTYTSGSANNTTLLSSLPSIKIILSSSKSRNSSISDTSISVGHPLAQVKAASLATVLARRIVQSVSPGRQIIAEQKHKHGSGGRYTKSADKAEGPPPAAAIKPKLQQNSSSSSRPRTWRSPSVTTQPHAAASTGSPST
ncbi:hypothetical protein Emed_007190 [Eimeria media]